MTAQEPLFFQDLIQSTKRHTDEELSLLFFELANASLVGYRLEEKHLRRNKPSKHSSAAGPIVIQQDPSACGQHTGGIVWETSYLLINYLLSRKSRLGKMLEVGAGCGMLGLVLAGSGWVKRATLTEVVMDNLEENVNRNKIKGAVAQKLDWQHPEQTDMHSFDTIVGTDVVFTTALVEPLLSTLLYMSHDKTVVYLCLQVRCPDSHELLLNKASHYSWAINDISPELASIPECAWGLQMDCRLLKLTRILQDEKSETVKHNDKKRKSTSATMKRKKQQ